jgi:cyclohexanone monooxygenase
VWNSGGCASWYLDDEGRNTVVWPDQTYRFVRRTKRFDTENYEVS